MTDKKLIIFICSGNTCRSPMAAALFKAGLTDSEQETFEVGSYGIATFGGEPASNYAVEVMKENGIDISSHRSTPLNRFVLSNAALVICMTKAHADVLINAGVEPKKLIVFNIPDPFGGTLQDYRACAESIKTELVKVYDRIR